MTLTATLNRWLHRTPAEPVLPPLTRPCPDCEGKGFTVDTTEWDEWNTILQAAKQAYDAETAAGKHSPVADFAYTIAWQQMMDSEPAREYGCAECDAVGSLLTAAGQQITSMLFTEDVFEYHLKSWLYRNGYRPER